MNWVPSHSVAAYDALVSGTPLTWADVVAEPFGWSAAVKTPDSIGSGLALCSDGQAAGSEGDVTELTGLGLSRIRVTLSACPNADGIPNSRAMTMWW